MLAVCERMIPNIPQHVYIPLAVFNRIYLSTACIVPVSIFAFLFFKREEAWNKKKLSGQKHTVTSMYVTHAHSRPWGPRSNLAFCQRHIPFAYFRA